MVACCGNRDGDRHAGVSAHPGTKSTDCRPSSQHDRLAGNPTVSKAVLHASCCSAQARHQSIQFLHAYFTTVHYGTAMEDQLNAFNTRWHFSLFRHTAEMTFVNGIRASSKAQPPGRLILTSLPPTTATCKTQSPARGRRAQ